MKIYLNAVRANADMTQDEWAKKLGVDKQTVSNWENCKGGGEPTMSQLRTMSELSGIPVEYIFLRSNPNNWGLRKEE